MPSGPRKRASPTASPTFFVEVTMIRCGCGCGEHDEDVLIAKIVMGESGEEEYIEPTDEEFDAVQRAYDALMDE
ncbi:MAG: DUF1292 domain-containing protein, partial [Selenomonas sp.]|nr:DUF1292 domain-containing protein [Selenomonas sp.]